MAFFADTNSDRSYQLRVFVSVAATLLVLIALVRWFPTPDTSSDDRWLFGAHDQEVIDIEEIIPTQQQQAPPPPSSLPPVVVPDEVDLPEIELDFTDSFLEVDDPSDDPELVDGDPEASSAPAASRSARLVRVVEPDYPSEAKRRNIQARLVLQLVVNENGRVDDVRIIERWLLDTDTGEEQRVARLGYGIEEAAVEAAERVQYRPAVNNGEAVAEVTTYTVTLGL